MRRRLRKALWYLLCVTFVGNIFLFVLHLSISETALFDMDIVKSRAEKDWDREQQRRQDLIQKTCREVRESDDLNPWRKVSRSLGESMMIDDVDEIMFCPSPHHKSSAWTSALHSLIKTYTRSSQTSNVGGSHRGAPQPQEREDRIIDKGQTDDLQINSQRELNQFLKKYIKILFVTHPFERLLAVYQDHFTNLIENRRSKYWNTLRRKILRVNHPSAGEEELSRAQVTFEEYIQYLVFKQEHNVHWSVTYELCHPCDIHYDYIVKFETLRTDIKYIMKNLYGSTESLTSAIGAQTLMKRNDIKSLRGFYKQPALNSLLYLYDIYSLDFYMYNYTWPFKTLTL